MKNFKQIIASLLTFMLLATLLVPSMGVSAATNYVFELGLDNIKDEVYEFMAYDIVNNQLHQLETASRATWSPEWPGHFVIDNDSIYVIARTERDGNIVDMLPRTSDQLAPAIVFTAPAAGKYNFVAEFNKLYGENGSGTSFVDIMLVKASNGEVIMNEEKVAHGEVKWVKKNVELAEGEQVCIVVVVNAESTRTSGGHNVALKSLLVNETVQQTTATTTTNNQTTAGGDDAPDNTTAPGNNDVDGNEDAEKVDPIIIVACVGGALVVIAIIVGIVVGAKKKKK